MRNSWVLVATAAAVIGCAGSGSDESDARIAILDSVDSIESTAQGFSETRIVGNLEYYNSGSSGSTGQGYFLVPRATIWSESGAVVSTKDRSFYYSTVVAIEGDREYGNSNFDAGYWVDDVWTPLVSEEVRYSLLTAARNGIQVGRITTLSETRATLWRGSESTQTDLHDNRFTDSQLSNTDGNHHVGWVKLGHGFGGHHAAVWGDTAESALILHPEATRASEALDIDAEQIVGFTVGEDGAAKAALWSGTPWSYVDLHQSEWEQSRAKAVADGYQAGSARVGGSFHAMLWQGSPESAIDLHSLLPPRYHSSSVNDIKTQGDALTILMSVTGDSSSADSLVMTVPLKALVKLP
jgi:hypothetical protein